MKERIGLRLRFALFFAALFLGGTAAILGGLWVGYSRVGGAADGYVIAGVIGIFALLGVTTWVSFLFDEYVAKPILALTSDLNTRAQATVDQQIDEQPARYLGALAPAANAINDALTELRQKQELAIARATSNIGRDRALFEALLHDLAEGVVVVTPNQRVMLFNRVAQELLSKLGLDRMLSSCLQVEPLDHALVRLAARLDADPAAVESFLASTKDGEKFLLGRVGSISADGEQIGYVLIFHDTTEELTAHREQDHLFNILLEGTRRPVAAVSAVLDVLQTDAEMPPDMRVTLNASMQEEIDRLISRLQDISVRHDTSVVRHWPMSRVSTNDVYYGLSARNITALSLKGEDHFMTCDAFAVVEILSSMLRRLAESGTRSAFLFQAWQEETEIRIGICWSGEEVTDGQLENWLQRPLSPVYGQFTGRDALKTHRTDVWAEQSGEGYRLVLPLSAAAAPELRPSDERPEFYDFNLPETGQEAGLDDKQLTKLPFVVFDTETTGLSPRGGDEIVQIAGVRIVNGRILRGDVFNTLVDPKRSIPAASSAVHGITDEMVRGASDIASAGQAFHDFCEGSVLVAHNAPFDLAFLHLKEDRIGHRFDHPVLCTVLLSAAMFGHTGLHTLDALAERFGVELPEDVRHTALGDALATAEVFIQLLEIMAAANIITLGEAKEAARQMTKIRRNQKY